MSRELGFAMEDSALRHLEHNGLKLIKRNFHCKLGEIDLIMSDHGTLVFIEVRYRKNTAYGSPAATVNSGKQKKLVRSAQYFLQRHRRWREYPCRFDVVGISQAGGDFSYQWIQHAFIA